MTNRLDQTSASETHHPLLSDRSRAPILGGSPGASASDRDQVLPKQGASVESRADGGLAAPPRLWRDSNTSRRDSEAQCCTQTVEAVAEHLQWRVLLAEAATAIEDLSRNPADKDAAARLQNALLDSELAPAAWLTKMHRERVSFDEWR